MIWSLMLRFIEPRVGLANTILVIAGMLAFLCLVAVALASHNPAQRPTRPTSWIAPRTYIDASAFRQKSFLALAAATACFFLVFYGPFFGLEAWSFATGVGYKGTFRPDPNVPSLRTYYILCVLNGSSTIGRLTASLLSDALGALQVHAAVSALAGLLCLALWTQAESFGPAIAFVVLFGAVSGAVIGLPPADVNRVLGEERQGRLGTWLGMVYFFAAVPQITGPVICGVLVEHGYIAMESFIGAGLMIAAAFFVLAAVFHCKEQKAQAQTEKEGLGEQAV